MNFYLYVVFMYLELLVCNHLYISMYVVLYLLYINFVVFWFLWISKIRISKIPYLCTLYIYVCVHVITYTHTYASISMQICS